MCYASTRPTSYVPLLSCQYQLLEDCLLHNTTMRGAEPPPRQSCGSMQLAAPQDCAWPVPLPNSGDCATHKQPPQQAGRPSKWGWIWHIRQAAQLLVYHC
jgi:hypothetical protein